MTSSLPVVGLVLCAVINPITTLWPNVEDQLRGRLPMLAQESVCAEDTFLPHGAVVYCGIMLSQLCTPVSYVCGTFDLLKTFKTRQKFKKRKTAWLLLIINSSARPKAELSKRLGTWDLRDGNYSSVAVPQNLNARKELQRNCRTYCCKLYTVLDCITKEKVILTCCFIVCMRFFFERFLKHYT